MLPKKHLGQHFLLDREAISNMLDCLPLRGKKVLEIGAGTGVVSEAIAERKPKKLTSIEIDLEAAQKARGRLKGFKNAELVIADIRDVDFEDFDVLVGSIPYYLSSYLVFKALAAKKPTVFLVQKEFAERLVGKAGTSNWSRLSLMAQSQADVKLCFEVPRFSFLPPPEVDSAVVLFTPKKPLALDDRLVTALFSHKNQSVKKAFIHSSASLGLDKAAAKKKAAVLPFSEKRVRNLTMEEWDLLCRFAKEKGY